MSDTDRRTRATHSPGGDPGAKPVPASETPQRRLRAGIAISVASRAAAALVVTLFAGACAGGAGAGGGETPRTSGGAPVFPEAPGDAADSGDTPDGPFAAQDLLDAGDYDRAARAYAKLVARSPGDPALAESLRTAKRLAAQKHAVAASKAAEARQWAVAAAELEKAETYDRDAEPVRRVRAALGPKIADANEFQAEKGRARELLVTDPKAALDLLLDLRRRAPYDADLPEMLSEATRRTEAGRAADRAAEAWDAGVRQRAVEHLAAASFGGQPTPGAQRLMRRMENDLVAESATATLPALRESLTLATAARLGAGALDAIRDRAAAAFGRTIREHEAAGRPACAALFELDARRLGVRVELRNVERVRADRAVTIHVRPFDDETGGSADGLRIARALRDRLAIDAATLAGGPLATDAPVPDGAAGARLVLSGAITHRRVSSSRPHVESRKTRYVAGTRSSVNPDASRLNDALAAARGRMERTQNALDAAETRLRHLKDLAFGRGPGGGPGTEAEVAYRSRLAEAEAAAETARRAAAQARQEEFTVRQAILTTPAEVSEAVWAETSIEVTTLVRTAEVTGRVRLQDGGSVLLDESVTGTDVHRETVSPGFASGGIPADPDESPDEAAMDARAAAEFAGNASARIRAAAARSARRLLEDARAAERRGDPDAAAESYAAYLVTTADGATIERADAARAILGILRFEPSIRAGAPAGRGR